MIIFTSSPIFALITTGMPNASIPTPEPVKQRKMFGAYGKAVGETSVIFVSQAAAPGLKEKYGINKRAVPVKRCD